MTRAHISHQKNSVNASPIQNQNGSLAGVAGGQQQPGHRQSVSGSKRLASLCCTWSMVVYSISSSGRRRWRSPSLAGARRAKVKPHEVGARHAAFHRARH